ncbi:MAG: hypothetical protein HXM94_00720 [Parvimonas micra]|uniref:Uncharacterized protein n=1 Tax=Parvimonas micra TaxID=33033 RepID=A0A930DZP7_9FIRM|nr:hypothetical protein [Parvimonas micra]MBF1306297.1 hypothetical protein [Parvimonas micra]
MIELQNKNSSRSTWLNETIELVKSFSIEDLSKVIDIQLMNDNSLFLDTISEFKNQFNKERFLPQFWKSNVLDNYKIIFSGSNKVPEELKSAFNFLKTPKVFSSVLLLDFILANEANESYSSFDGIRDSLKDALFVENYKKLPQSIQNSLNESASIQSQYDINHSLISLLKENNNLVLYLRTLSKLAKEFIEFGFSISFSIKDKKFKTLTELQIFSEDYYTPVKSISFGFSGNPKVEISTELEFLLTQLAEGKTFDEAIFYVFKNAIEEWVGTLSNESIKINSYSTPELVKQIESQKIPIEILSDEHLKLCIDNSFGKQLMNFYIRQETQESRNRIKESILELFKDTDLLFENSTK